MIDQFMATSFGRKVSQACAVRFLRDLPPDTKLIVMFGLGAGGIYVRMARKAIQAARPGEWKTVNEVAYADGKVTMVHVEHFASQGANIPNWLGQADHSRARLGTLAREAVQRALSREARTTMGPSALCSAFTEHNCGIPIGNKAVILCLGICVAAYTLGCSRGNT